VSRFTRVRVVWLYSVRERNSLVRLATAPLIKGKIMSIKTAILCTALGIGALAAPMIGSARVFVDVDVAPPAAQVEVIPAGRAGYVWAPGYWNWSGHEHVWAGGHYIRERQGHHWVGDNWEQRGTRWHHSEGHWD
jgi:hypothetical protein